MKKREIVQKLDIIIFIILLFFQNFAIIKTNSFGIAALTVFLLYIAIKYKIYLKLNKKIMISLFCLLFFITFSQLMNNAFDILQLLRFFMIIFVAYITIEYIKNIYLSQREAFFNKIFTIVLITISIYGIYQLLAGKFNLPLILNFFNNNPSYGARGIFEDYTGWVDTARLYTTFYEPSAYAIFITFAYFYIMNTKSDKKTINIITTILVVVNLFFTYSRSGWVTFAYFIIIYFMFKILKRESVLKKIGKAITVLLPFITLIIMSTLGVYIFKDLSSMGRTYSSLYYISNSVNNIKSFLIGHGLGAMLKVSEGLLYNGYIVEKFSHNGYIDIIYQLGVPFFSIIIVSLLKGINKAKLSNNWIVYASVFTLCCFGSVYNVESIISMVCLIVSTAYCEVKKENKYSKQEKIETIIKGEKMKEDVLVSICCITYNQEEYIRDALDSFLMQKTNFKYEIIVHDDASTDNTPNIIREYEEKYPDIIKPIYQKENQSRKGKKVSLITYKHAIGKYIAICEGDDYWIDENKLQLQADYMEKNPECTLLFHNAKVVDMVSKEETIFVPLSKQVKEYMKKDGNYNVGELELLEFIPTASYMFRTENVQKFPNWFEKCFVGDWPLRLLMTSFGYAHYMEKTMSVYRKNARGSITVRNEKKEKESIEGKLDILNKKIELMDWINEFTNEKYKDVFDLRKTQFKIEELMTLGKNKEILKNGYLKIFNTKQKIKYLIKMYCPNIIRLYKKIMKK